MNYILTGLSAAAAIYAGYQANRMETLVLIPDVHCERYPQQSVAPAHSYWRLRNVASAAATDVEIAVKYHVAKDTTTLIYPERILVPSIMNSDEIPLPDVVVNARYDAVYMKYRDSFNRMYCSVTEDDKTTKRDVSVCDAILQPLHSYVTPLQLQERLAGQTKPKQ